MCVGGGGTPNENLGPRKFCSEARRFDFGYYGPRPPHPPKKKESKKKTQKRLRQSQPSFTLLLISSLGSPELRLTCTPLPPRIFFVCIPPPDVCPSEAAGRVGRSTEAAKATSSLPPQRFPTPIITQRRVNVSCRAAAAVVITT